MMLGLVVVPLTRLYLPSWPEKGEENFPNEDHLVRAAEFSQPRFPSIRDYARMVGFNCEEALTRINGAPKLY